MNDLDFERAGASEVEDLATELRALRDRARVVETALGVAMERLSVSLDGRRRARAAAAVACGEERQR